MALFSLQRTRPAEATVPGSGELPRTVAGQARTSAEPLRPVVTHTDIHSTSTHSPPPKRAGGPRTDPQWTTGRLSDRPSDANVRSQEGRATSAAAAAAS